jgi:hypothetical protein
VHGIDINKKYTRGMVLLEILWNLAAMLHENNASELQRVLYGSKAYNIPMKIL